MAQSNQDRPPLQWGQSYGKVRELTEGEQARKSPLSGKPPLARTGSPLGDALMGALAGAPKGEPSYPAKSRPKLRKKPSKY